MVYLRYILAASLAYILSWLVLVLLVDYFHLWVGYSSIISTILSISINWGTLRLMWGQKVTGCLGYIKAVGLSYLISWILLVIFVSWFDVWVGLAAIIVTVLVFNLKFLLLKKMWMKENGL